MKGQPCVAGERRCEDGSCVSIWDYCGQQTSPECPWGQPLCSDGRCMPRGRNCDGSCPEDQKLCSGGCVPKFYSCLHQMKPCDSSRPYSCDQGSTCYSSFQQCDGYHDCVDAQDEMDCAGNGSHQIAFLSDHWYTILLLVLLAMAVWIVFFCWRNRLKPHEAFYRGLNRLRHQTSPSQAEASPSVADNDSSAFLVHNNESHGGPAVPAFQNGYLQTGSLLTNTPLVPPQIGPPSYEESMSQQPAGLIPTAPPSYSEAVAERHPVEQCPETSPPKIEGSS